MATTLADTAANTIYQWLYRGQTAASGSRYFALYTNVSAGTEATGGGYTRQDAITPLDSTPSAGDGANTGSVSFTVAAGTYDGVGIWDASSAGTELVRWPLDASRTVGGGGGTITFNVNDLMCKVDGSA